MYPQNPETLQGIYKASFFDNVISGNAARYYPRFCKDVKQDTATVTWTSFGSVPEPVQLTGTAATAGIPIAKGMKDYKLATTVQEYQVKVAMPRSVAEDNPQDAQNMVGKLGGKASFYYDRAFHACLASTTLLGYDGKALFSTTHGESGSSQDNAKTAALGALDNVADWETVLVALTKALMGFTDDQGTYVNEGASRFTILCNSSEWLYANLTVNPTIGVQPADVTGATGKFRGMFDVVASGIVPAQTAYVFINGGDPAVGFFHTTDWDLSSNMYTDSDLWKHSNTAMFTGYARFAFYPWKWSSAARYVST